MEESLVGIVLWEARLIDMWWGGLQVSAVGSEATIEVVVEASIPMALVGKVQKTPNI